MAETTVPRVTHLDGGRVRAFRDHFRGEVIEPGASGYDDARRLWNAIWDRRPAIVARPTSPDDVAAAIRFAREEQLPVAVRGGGHGAAGHGTMDGGLLVDLGALRDVTVDADRKVARVGGGALLSQLDTAAQARGLVCPVGVVGHTGVGGLTLGGGNGRLQRKLGMTIDSLRAVELVTADGRQVRVTAESEPELFYGIRGAGANFGIVTTFEFDLHPYDGTITRSVRMYDIRHVHEVWGRFRDFAAVAPDELILSLVIARAVPEADYPPGVAGSPIVIVGLNHCGDPATVERDTAPLAAGPEAFLASGGTVPYLELQAMNDEPMGWGHRAWIQGALVDDLAPGTLDALVEHVGSAPGESSVALAALGGAISRIPPEATAYPGRTAGFDISADGLWDDPAEDESTIAWIRRALAIAEPDALEGCYVNELSDDDPVLGPSIYGRAAWARLVALKRAWDPENVFRANQNIPPAGE